MLIPDETCWFLAVDFDKRSWMSDVAAFRDAGALRGRACSGGTIAVSGNGAHAWIFFSEPVQAAKARRLGALLCFHGDHGSLPRLSASNYTDRFFPV